MTDRIIVAQAAVDGAPDTRLCVGIARWRGEEPFIAVVVKMSYGIDLDGEQVQARLLAEQAALSPERVSELGDADPDTLAYASDFVVKKAACDVLLTGHAHAAEPATRIELALRLGAVDRRLSATSAAARSSIPLTAAHLRDTAGEIDVETLGPLALPSPQPGVAVFSEFDFSSLQSAPVSQRIDHLEPGSTLELRGLSPRAAKRLVVLPTTKPRVQVEPIGWDAAVLDMTCDTLWIDTDFEQLTLVWRGTYLLKSGSSREIDRLVVSLERADSPRTSEQLLRALPRGHFFFAQEEAHLTADDEPGDAEELELARLETLEHAPETNIALAEYARISAELAEQTEPREETLKRNDFDEHRWMLEERAWLEEIGDGLSRDDGRLAAEYGELFVVAQRALESPIEPRSLEEYAQISVALERSQDPAATLKTWAIGMGEWMRLHEHWNERSKQSRKVAQRLEQLLHDERARAAAGAGQAEGGA